MAGLLLWDLFVLREIRAQGWQVPQDGAAGNTCSRGHHRVRSHMLQVLSLANLRLPGSGIQATKEWLLVSANIGSLPLCPGVKVLEIHRALSPAFLPSAQELKWGCSGGLATGRSHSALSFLLWP